MHCSSTCQYKLVRYSLLINNINWWNERLGFLKRVFFTLLLLLYALYSNNPGVICYLPTSLAFLQQGNVKKSKKLVNVVNIEEENLHIFWTSWEIPMKFSGKMWLMIILKVTKEQISTHSPKNIFLEEPHRGRGGGSCFLAVLGLRFAEIDNA